MTTVSPVNTAGTASETALPTKSTLDYDAFLKLLVTQMKNQDPTEPMNSTEYVAQLASFSNVEQSVKANDKLDQILQVSAIAQAGSLIGRTLETPDGAVTGTITEIRIFNDGLMATLEGGEEVVIGGGVTIR